MVPIVVNIAMTVVMTIVMSIGVIWSESTIVGVTRGVVVVAPVEVARSEERRVGKECRL